MFFFLLLLFVYNLVNGYTFLSILHCVMNESKKAATTLYHKANKNSSKDYWYQQK